MPPRMNMKAPSRPKNVKGTMKRMLAYMQGYKKQLILVAVCILVSAVVGAVGTYMLQPAIDNFITPLIGCPHSPLFFSSWR